MSSERFIGYVLTDKYKKIFFCILGLLVVISLIQSLGKAYRPDGYDLSAYIYASRALINGTDPYYSNLAFIYIYPLFLAFILTPLVLLPYWIINVAWFSIGVGCLYFISVELLKITKHLTKCDSSDKYVTPIFFSCLVCFSSIHNTFLNGQVNLLVLFCDIMFFRSFFYKKNITASLWLAAAISIKLTPAIFIFFLLMRKKYGMLLLTVTATLIFMFLPALFCGYKIFSYYEYYLNHFVLNKLTATDKIIVDIDGFAPGFNLQSVIGLSYPTAFKSVTLKILSLLTVSILILLADITSLIGKGENKQFLGFSAYILGSLLLSPMGENHHTVVIYPIVLFFSSMYFFNKQWRDVYPQWLTALFLLTFLVMPSVLKETAYYFIPLLVLLVVVIFSGKIFAGKLSV